MGSTRTSSSSSSAQSPLTRLGSKAAKQTIMIQLVSLLEEKGPRINEIAREMKVFRESVRYWYKHRLIRRHYVVQAIPDYGRLGLRRLMMLATVKEKYRKSAVEKLNQLGVGGYFALISHNLPDDRWTIEANVPSQYVDEFCETIRELNLGQQFFAGVEIFKLDWFEHARMQARFFNFEANQWEVDWSLIEKASVRSKESDTPAVKFDYEDLRMISELQENADKSTTEIAKELGMSYKSARVHLKHITGRGLIKSYRVRWLGTVHSDTEKATLVRTHKYAMGIMIVHNVTPEEASELQMRLEGFPFIWAMGAGADLVAELAIPVQQLNEALRHLRELLGAQANKARMHLSDQDESAAFSLPYQMYDRTHAGWRFRKSDLVKVLKNG